MAGNVIHNVKLLGFVNASEYINAPGEGEGSRLVDPSSVEKTEAEELGVLSSARSELTTGEGSVSMKNEEEARVPQADRRRNEGDRDNQQSL